MGKSKKEISPFISSAVIALLLLINTAFDVGGIGMFGFLPSEIQFLIGLFLFLVSVVYGVHKYKRRADDLESYLPNLTITDYDIECKTWGDGRTNLVVYIAVENKLDNEALNASAKAVLASVNWFGDLQSNPGRWFYTNRDRKSQKNTQIVDIEPNGETKKLHFAAVEMKDLRIRAIWDNGDNKVLEDISKKIEPNYKIKITLKDAKSSEATFFFNLSLENQNQDTCILITQTDEDGKEIGNTKQKCISDLQKYNPQQELSGDT